MDVYVIYLILLANFDFDMFRRYCALYARDTGLNSRVHANENNKMSNTWRQAIIFVTLHRCRRAKQRVFKRSYNIVR